MRPVARDQPPIKWEEQALEVLHYGAEIAVREFEYGEKNNESLDAAKQHGWHVVSMKNDWKKVFSFDK